MNVHLPYEYGGLGLTTFPGMLIGEELSWGCAGIAVSIGANGLGAAPVLIAGTDEQKREWLPPLIDAPMLCSFALSEPDAGSDVARIKTTAERRGGEYVLNGSKTFITNGYSADLVVAAVRTDPSKGARGISLLAVETGMPGFTRGRKLDKVGQDESDTAELFFHDVRVPVANRIGDEGQGFIAMMERLPQERIGAAVSNLAQARAILLETIEYAKQRQAFGRAIGSFQHNKFLLAELVTKIEVAQAYIDAGVLAHCRRELTSVDAAKAKWWSSQVQNEVLDACVQLHGGYGYMNEYRVTRAWRDARVTKIWAGSNEIMKELIGRDLGL
jgi:alkylation response protein AidB-like acyl-CoA dehydrogenase